MVSTPLPLPVHFSHAQQSFSLKKRRLPFSSSVSSESVSPSHPLSGSLPPRPPSKGPPPVSRVFPQRRSPWTPLSRKLINNPPPCSLYDPTRPQSFFSQCFISLGLIGRGSFGEVYKVRSLLDGRLYAVKRSVQRFRGEAGRLRCIKEAHNHEHLHPHPHILDFSAAWEEGGHLYIQTELCCTSLLLHTEGLEENPGETCVWDYLCDLLLALDHLHSKGFAHLDLKPANVFLTRSGRLKLGDFGLVIELPTANENESIEGKSEGQKKKDDLQEGDPRYMAPELLRGEYGPAADVFSLGVSILELSCNIEVPKGGEGWQQLRKGQLPSEFTNDLSTELQDVLKLMLTPEPRDRATVKQLLSLHSVRKHQRRRHLTLRLRESWLSILTFAQFILSAGWSFLLSLNLPFIPRCPPQAPCTPPRESWEREGDISAVFSEADTISDDPVFVSDPFGLEDSPLFKHRIQTRVSVGSTSTPLPNSSNLSHTPPRSITHTPPSVRLDCSSYTPAGSPSLSPISFRFPAKYNLCEEFLRLSESPASKSSHSSCAESEQKSGFEPKNLLNLFDGNNLESEP